MQATRRQKKQSPAGEPAWEEWVSRPGGNAAMTRDLNSMHDAIANLAYSYWEARGCQGGSAEEDWLRAEEKILLSTDK
jgi:hypothetical protein